MPSESPNILLIMTDQQRGDCLSIEGHPVLQTPNMNSIAGAGARFRRTYTTCPSCVAARRSLLSGQFPPTHGVVGYRDGVEWDAPTTLPQALHNAGYETFLAGRCMHQSPHRKRYGYDHMVIDGWDSDYRTWLEEKAPDAGGKFGSGVMHNDWTVHPWPMAEHLHYTNWTVDQSLRFLRRRDPSCPFFLTVSFLAPHPPLQPPAFYLERYLRTGVPDPVIGDWATPPDHDGLGDEVSPSRISLTDEALRSTRAAYYGLINHVDDQMRRLLNPITGVDRDTIIVFTSDHGEMLGDHYHWRKQVPYESSARIPLLVSAPQRFGLNQRAVIDEPACLEDVMPTLLDLAGVDVPDTVEGRSLVPLMRGERPDWRSYLHLEHAPLHHTLTNGREKFIWFVEDGREQFFDLRNDPNELHDLVNDPGCEDRIALWHQRLIEELDARPEGFTDGTTLIPGRPYEPCLPHAGVYDENWQQTPTVIS
jgi:arylsulfatase